MLSNYCKPYPPCIVRSTPRRGQAHCDELYAFSAQPIISQIRPFRAMDSSKNIYTRQLCQPCNGLAGRVDAMTNDKRKLTSHLNAPFYFQTCSPGGATRPVHITTAQHNVSAARSLRLMLELLCHAMHKRDLCRHAVSVR